MKILTECSQILSKTKLLDAYAICHKYSPEQLRFVQTAVNNYMRAVNNSFDAGKPSNKDAIKAEWMEEARVYEILTSEQFNELWDAVMAVEESKISE